MEKKTGKVKKSTVKKTKKKTVNENDKVSNIEENIEANGNKKFHKKLFLRCFIFIISLHLFFIVSIFMIYKDQEKNCEVGHFFVKDFYGEPYDCSVYDYLSEDIIKLRKIYNNIFFNDLEERDVFKPLIYLYPSAESEVSVKLGNSHKISHSYPKYEGEWVVRAKPNGDLAYNNRPYYGLYWEGKSAPKFEFDEGFVVKGSDTITFLEEKLAIFGLNEREANEFIIYWLPKLENNPYNFIKFASLDVQNEYMPLEINPKPDTLIRIMMAYKKLDNPIEVREQVLAPTPVRNGFTVVEWGGTEINSDKVY